MNTRNLRFLVVTAHPHDFICVAGTCGIHASSGDTVTLVSMTAGASTHNEKLYDEISKPARDRDPAVTGQTAEEYAEQKKKEFRKAASLFHIKDVRVLSYPDMPFIMEHHPEAVEEIREIILEIRPQILITQSPYLEGPHGHKYGGQEDHTETAYTVFQARMLAQGPQYGQSVAPHTIAAVYFPGIYFNREDWDFVIDIDDWFEKIVEAESIFVSQGHTEQFSRKRMTSQVGSTGW